MRLRNDSRAKKYLEESNIVLKKFPVKLDKKTILEIGMGKGEMLSFLAFNNPDYKYIGIEKFPTVAAKAVKRVEKLNLKNMFIICDDVEKIIDKLENNVNEIWLTFPDPWPKKRHFKRRLTYKKYLDIYKKLLFKNGVLKFKTDNDLLFDWSIEQFKEYGVSIVYMTNDLHQSIKNESNIKTGYEIKWSSKGKNIHYVEIKF